MIFLTKDADVYVWFMANTDSFILDLLVVENREATDRRPATLDEKGHCFLPRSLGKQREELEDQEVPVPGPASVTPMPSTCPPLFAAAVLSAATVLSATVARYIAPTLSLVCMLSIAPTPIAAPA